MNSGCQQVTEIKKGFINLLERLVDLKRFNESWESNRAELQQLDSIYQDELQNANIEKILDSYLESRERLAQNLSNERMRASDGGPGSGNFGHKGRPGQVGGSSKEGGGELAKVSVDPTLADIDDHLAEVGIRKGDVVKAFGLRKDVLLTHLQNRLKDGDKWRGVFKDEEAYNEAKSTLDKLRADGVAEDDKAVVKLKRSIARWDFVQGLASKLEGDEPKQEEPKAEEPKVKKERVKKELPVKAEEPKVAEEPKAEEPLGEGEVETELTFKANRNIDKSFEVWGTHLDGMESFDKALRNAGVTGEYGDNTLEHVWNWIDMINLPNFSTRRLQRDFKDDMESGVKNGLVSPDLLDKMIKERQDDLNETMGRDYRFVTAQYAINDFIDLMGLLDIKKKQGGLTQKKFDSMQTKNKDFPRLTAVIKHENVTGGEVNKVIIKSKLSDAGDIGRKVIDELIPFRNIKQDVIDYEKEVKKRGYGKKILTDGKVIEGVLEDEDSSALVKKHISNPSVGLMCSVVMELNKKAMASHGERSVLEVAQEMLANNKKSYKTAYYKSLVSGIQRIDDVMGHASYYRKFEGEISNDSHDKTALGNMVLLMAEDFYETAKSLGVETNNAFTNLLRLATDKNPFNRRMQNGLQTALVTYGKISLKSLKTTEKEMPSKQGNYLNQLENASAKPDIENQYINTKVGNIERTAGKNNRSVMDSVFHGMGVNWDDFYNYTGERSEYQVDKQIASKSMENLMMVDDEKQSEFEFISKTDKVNYKLLDTDEIKQLLTAMTISGHKYSPIKAPNKFGSQNIISMLTATGKIANSKDRKAIRYENEEDGYRNYDFKVGDTVMFDGMHASTSQEFADGFARSCFGEGKPCRFEVEGDYPYLDLEPFVWKDKKLVEYEQLMAGFFKVKSIQNDVPFDVENHEGRRVKGSERVVKLEFDWDRLQDFLSLQARSFANYYNMYGKNDKDKDVLW